MKSLKLGVRINLYLKPLPLNEVAKISNFTSKTNLQLNDVLIGTFIISYTLWYYWSSHNLGFNSDAFVLISPMHFSGFWGSLAWDGTYHYMPVTAFWLWIQHLFLGLNEPSYQIINIVQQGVIAILVFWLARELIGKRNLALLSALLFTSSASYYEVVLWSIVGSNYHVSMFFYLIGLIAFIRFLKTGRKWKYGLFTACVGLSLFAHELTLSLTAVIIVYYLFVHLPDDDQWQFWKSWLNGRAWVNLGRLLIGPVIMVGVFLAVKLVMSLYTDVVGQTQSLGNAVYWFNRGLFSTLTFRGDDDFITGQLVNFFGGPEQTWIWLTLLIPLLLLLFVLWFNRLERFLLLWLLGQLLMTQLAIGISPRHLYMPAIAAAILLVSVGSRLLNLVIAPLTTQDERVNHFKVPVLYSLVAIVFIIPAHQDLKQAEQLWQHVSAANQSLKQTITEVLQTETLPYKLYLVNATRYLYKNGFAAWTFQNGLSNSITLNFPNQFTEIHQLYYLIDSNNVANGSRRGNLAEIDGSILDKKGYLWLLYLPDEYRFVHLTQAYLAEKGLESNGIRANSIVYTPETAPSLDWQDGAWPWLNLSPEQILNLALKNPAKDQPWLAIYNLVQEGRDVTVEVNGEVIGELMAPSNQEPTWLNETMPLPPGQLETIELALRGTGTIPANFAQVGLFGPQQVYNAENNQALWWDGEGFLKLAPGTSLSLPFTPCLTATCQLSITYLAEPESDFSIIMNERLLESTSPALTDNGWATTTLIPTTPSPVLTFQVTGTAPILIKELGLYRTTK